jgi:hypothetical protein
MAKLMVGGELPRTLLAAAFAAGCAGGRRSPPPVAGAGTPFEAGATDAVGGGTLDDAPRETPNAGAGGADAMAPNELRVEAADVPSPGKGWNLFSPSLHGSSGGYLCLMFGETHTPYECDNLALLAGWTRGGASLAVFRAVRRPHVVVRPDGARLPATMFDNPDLTFAYELASDGTQFYWAVAGPLIVEGEVDYGKRSTFQPVFERWARRVADALRTAQVQTCVRHFPPDDELRRAAPGSPSTISGLLRIQPGNGTFTVEGYLQNPHHCAPTAADAAQPCNDDVWLSEAFGAFKHGMSSSTDLDIYVPDASRFEALKRYRLTVVVCGSRTQEPSVPKFELRGYTPL